MSNFCGKCGASLTPQGNCPNCAPNPNQTFFNNQEGTSGSFEIPQNTNSTVYAKFNDDNIDSANIPQNQPPVLYEGNVPVADVPSESSFKNNSRNSVSKFHKPKNSKSFRIKIVCLLLIICIIFVGVGVMSYNDVVYVPGASEKLKVSVDNKIYGEERNNFVITGEKISNSKIDNEDKALQVTKEFTEEKLGFESISDEYTLMNTSTVGNYTYYRFQENYKGYPVVGRTMTIIADKDGNSCGVSSNVIDINQNLKTDVSDFDKDKVLDDLKSFKETGVQVNINAYTKSIYSFDRCKEPLLTYEVLAVINNSNFKLFVDPKNGEVINGYCLDSRSGSDSDKDKKEDKGVILEGNGKNMFNNPQKFNGELQGDRFVTYDPEREISVYNAEKGSSTIAIEYIDSDNNSYYNRRFNPSNADNAPDNEVCVIYDDDGNYYEYDKEKDIFTDDKGVKIKYDDLEFEGYTVYNFSSGTSLELVGSKDKTIKDELAVRLMVKTAQTYDFFNDVLGRKGYNGSGGKMMAVCNDNLNDNPEQAFSAGDNYGLSMITFGYDNPMEWDDIAHEYTHSVEQSISALNYQNESGAIMEGYADVFGELVEDYCNDTGEPDNENLNKNCDWNTEERYIAVPLMNETPAVYKGSFYKDKIDDTDWKTSSNFGTNNDFGEVHNNSTVISHIAYLMAMDGNDDETLTTEEIANLWYRTLYILPSDCTFSAFRDCMELQANNMTESKDLTEKQRAYVSTCFDKANIQSTRYASDIELKVVADDEDNIYKVKIEGKRFKLFTLKDYSEEFELTEASENDDGKFEFVKTLNLKDGRYTIKVTDRNDKVKYFKREIVVVSDDKNPQYNSENGTAGFHFEEPKKVEVEIPVMPAVGADGEIPGTDIPSTDLP